MVWEGEQLRVFDLFCGAGGFSEGAKQALCRVVFACDSNRDALDVPDDGFPLSVHDGNSRLPQTFFCGRRSAYTLSADRHRSGECKKW